MTAAPPVDGFPVTTEELRARVAADGSIAGLFEAAVDRHPDRTLISFEDQRLSYAAVDAMANRLAGGLRDRGVERGDGVALMMANGPDWIALWLAAAKLGAVTVPVNTAHRGEGLSYVLGDSRAKVLVIDGDLAPHLAAVPGGHRPGAIFVSGDADHGYPGLSELRSAVDARPSRDDLSPSSPCCVLYTSGTTGPPKGCLLPHGQYLAAARLHSAACGFGSETTIYCCLPLFHVAAQTYSFLSMVCAGGTWAVERRFSASRFWSRVAETGATAINFVGAMAMALWNREPGPQDRAHCATLAFGAPMPVPIWEGFEERFGVRVVQAYGMTENALPILYCASDTPLPAHRRGAAGRISPTSDVVVVDDDDRPVPPGTVGQILTRERIPSTMMTEYVGRPDAMAEAFRDGWFHTGDLGRFDEDGWLYFVDRRRDALRRRGEMVSSWEIETLVSKFPGVAECAVVGVPSDMTEDDILVAVVCEGEPIDPEALIAYCEERTARFQVPRYVRIVDALPRTQTQRVEKYRLRAEGVTADTWDAQAVVR